MNRRIGALRSEQERLRTLLLEQQQVLMRRQLKVHEAFRLFEQVQQDFEAHPPLDESRFYSIAIDDEDASVSSQQQQEQQQQQQEQVPNPSGEDKIE